MTLNNLLLFFENFYGEKYSDIMRDTMIAYLGGWPQDYYKAAAGVITKRFSRIYNKVPGPAEFELHMAEIRDAIPTLKKLTAAVQKTTEVERAACSKMLIELKMSLSRREAGPMAGALGKIIRPDNMRGSLNIQKPRREEEVDF